MSRSLITAATIVDGHVQIVFPGFEGDHTATYPLSQYSIQDAIDFRRKKDISRRERHNALAKHLFPLIN